jgi:hypothetical protein
MSYEVYAWLPGTTKFIVKVNSGWGFLDARTEQYDPVDSDKLVERAVTKYHYKRIGPYRVEGPAQVRQIAESLGWP